MLKIQAILTKRVMRLTVTRKSNQSGFFITNIRTNIVTLSYKQELHYNVK